MNTYYNVHLTRYAQKLRKSMTKEERRIWYDFLKQLPQTIRRQKTFEKYIVDFYIESAKIVIEIDGSQHYDESGKGADTQRDAYLQNLGIRVLRYSNADVNYRFREVCEDILHHLKVPDQDIADPPCTTI